MLTWDRTSRVRLLGVEPPKLTESCKGAPSALDEDTLKAYAEKCGTEVALEWASGELGVDVTGCSNQGAKKSAECVANNYGITLDIITKDGEVKWDNVIRDAGAVGGIVVCASVGLEVAATVCGKIGAEIGKAVGSVVKTVGKSVIEVFFGSDEGGGWACGKSPGGIGRAQVARDIARYMKKGQKASATAEEKLGPTETAFYVYWDRLLKLQGMAQASGAIISALAKKAGVSPSAAAAAMNIAAPPGWSELVRPEFAPLDKSAWPDYMMNVGGLLSAVLDPRKLVQEVIVPRWQSPGFWSGIEPGVKTKPLVWYYFVVARGCPDNITNWGRIDDYASAKELLKQKGGIATPEFDWWVYSIPKSIDDFIRTAKPEVFDFSLALWKTSISTGIPAKIKRAQASSGSGSSLAIPLAFGAGVAALVIWALL